MKWLLKKILSFFKLAYITESEVEDLQNLILYHEENFQQAMRERHEFSVLATQLKEQVDILGGTSLLEEKRRNDELEKRQDKIEADLEKAEEYYKVVQKALSEALHNDPMYGFNKAMAFPGSTSVTTADYIEEGNEGKFSATAICGRSILFDQDTAAIRNLPDMRSKYQYGFNHLLKYGLVDQLARMIVNSGAIQLSYAYNKDCTTMELYYNVQVRKPDAYLTITIDGTEITDVK